MNNNMNNNYNNYNNAVVILNFYQLPSIDTNHFKTLNYSK